MEWSIFKIAHDTPFWLMRGLQNGGCKNIISVFWKSSQWFMAAVFSGPVRCCDTHQRLGSQIAEWVIRLTSTISFLCLWIRNALPIKWALLGFIKNTWPTQSWMWWRSEIYVAGMVKTSDKHDMNVDSKTQAWGGGCLVAEFFSDSILVLRFLVWVCQTCFFCCLFHVVVVTADTCWLCKLLFPYTAMSSCTCRYPVYHSVMSLKTFWPAHLLRFFGMLNPFACHASLWQHTYSLLIRADCMRP